MCVTYNSNVELLTFRISVEAWLKRITENRLSCLNKLRGFILVNIQTYKKNIQCLFVFNLWNFILCCFVYGRINKCISYSVFFANFSGILSRFFFWGGGISVYWKSLGSCANSSWQNFVVLVNTIIVKNCSLHML